MSKEAVFTMKLEPELRADFMAAAEATHRPASQVMRELMREFIRKQRQALDEEHLRQKFEADRALKDAENGRLHGDVEDSNSVRPAQALKGK
ncbi:TPA: CopG family ribbon-helix-helix protein [Pseudomonas aeruginosa]|nr:antitoxin of toxin-antitoxin stability system [Pseudomonas aeruginosa]HBN8615559.1 antitoxin of toxin-antitoxin stability system [Pseudomonas aeruginosa]HBO3332278.1 antitoxin of toxin-antitoxin stability system [Pseudomonas aeruginosa]